MQVQAKNGHRVEYKQLLIDYETQSAHGLACTCDTVLGDFSSC